MGFLDITAFPAVKDQQMRNRPSLLIGVCLTASALFVLLLAPAASAATPNRYSLKIHNVSKFTVAHIYVSNSEHPKWGPDEMKSFTLSPGRTFTVTNIKPGEYDIKFVDAKGRDCILKNKAITRDIAWKLTTEWIQQCRGWS